MFKPGDRVTLRRPLETSRPDAPVTGTVYEVSSMSSSGAWVRLTTDPSNGWAVEAFELYKEPASAGQADPADRTVHEPGEKPVGRKDDSGKLDMTLFDDMPLALAAVCEVMQWAITKKAPVPYERGSWLGVHPDRYRAAIGRHGLGAAAQANDPKYPNVPARFQKDDETGLLHLAHQACSALMALENTLREQREGKSRDRG